MGMNDLILARNFDTVGTSLAVKSLSISSMNDTTMTVFVVFGNDSEYTIVVSRDTYAFVSYNLVNGTAIPGIDIAMPDIVAKLEHSLRSAFIEDTIENTLAMLRILMDGRVQDGTFFDTVSELDINNTRIAFEEIYNNLVAIQPQVQATLDDAEYIKNIGTVVYQLQSAIEYLYDNSTFITDVKDSISYADSVLREKLDYGKDVLEPKLDDYFNTIVPKIDSIKDIEGKLDSALLLEDKIDYIQSNEDKLEIISELTPETIDNLYTVSASGSFQNVSAALDNISSIVSALTVITDLHNNLQSIIDVDSIRNAISIVSNNIDSIANVGASTVDWSSITGNLSALSNINYNLQSILNISSYLESISGVYNDRSIVLSVYNKLNYLVAIVDSGANFEYIENNIQAMLDVMDAMPSINFVKPYVNQIDILSRYDDEIVSLYNNISAISTIANRIIANGSLCPTIDDDTVSPNSTYSSQHIESLNAIQDEAISINKQDIQVVLDSLAGKQATIADNGLPVTKLDISGATDIGTSLADSDLIIVGNKKSVMSRIWTYISSKLTGAISTILTTNLTASRALISDGSGKISVSTITSTILGYLSNVSSDIQTQINGKAATNQTFYIGTTALPINRTTGAITLAETSISGNATTATTLQTARTINGVSFNGSRDITVYDSTKAPLASPAFTGTPTAPTAPAGTNTTQLATTAFVKTASESTGIGIGQSWTDVTSSRVAGTTYTNSTGKPIMVFISFGSYNTTLTQLFVNGVMCAGDVNYTSVAYVSSICAIIPNGSTYKVDYFQAVFLWSELR